VWWKFTAPANGVLTISTLGSSFDTLLGVYTGSVVSSLSTIASNDDYSGNTSQVSFSATTGTVYSIAVDGYAAASGSITLITTWAASPTSMFTATTPVRVFDTRPGEGGLRVVSKAKVGGGYVLVVKVTDLPGVVPATGVGAVSMNVTVAQPDGGGYVTVFPCGVQPLASSLNYVPGQTVANAVIAPVSAQGEV
jgi:hypothetical protein